MRHHIVLFQIISFEKYFYVFLGSNILPFFCGGPPICGGLEQLPSLPSLKSGPGYGFRKQIFHIHTIIDSATYDLFNKFKVSNHCITYLLPPHRPLHDALRIRGHQFQLTELHIQISQTIFHYKLRFRFLKYFS